MRARLRCVTLKRLRWAQITRCACFCSLPDRHPAPPAMGDAARNSFCRLGSALPRGASEDLAGSMRWCRNALSRLCRHLGAKELCLRLATGFSAYTNGTGCITTSSAFSGIGTPEFADACIAKTLVGFIQAEWQSTWGPTPQCPSFVAEFAIDKSLSCQEELLSSGDHTPRHLFGDISGFCPADCREMYGLVKGRPMEQNPDVLRQALCFDHLPNLRHHCVACGGPCLLLKCDLHTAGSPCTDHSSLGKGAKFKGANARHFFLWAGLCRRLQHRVIVHENVVLFGDLELRDALGDLHIKLPILLGDLQGDRGPDINLIIYRMSRLSRPNTGHPRIYIQGQFIPG